MAGSFGVLGDTYVRVRADMTQLRGDFAQAKGEATTSGRGLGLTFAKAFAVGFGAAAVVGIVTGLGRVVSALDQIGKSARTIGVSATFLQEMRGAAEFAGLSVNLLDDGLRRLNRRVGLFIQDGAGPAAKAFDQLGLSARISSGELRGTENIFNAAVEALEGIESQAEKTAIASQLFGEDAGPRLAPLLAQGSDAINEQRQLIATYADETVARAERVQDQIKELSESFKTMGTAVADNVLPVLNNLLDLILDLADARASDDILDLVEEISNLNAQRAEMNRLIQEQKDKGIKVSPLAEAQFDRLTDRVKALNRELDALTTDDPRGTARLRRVVGLVDEAVGEAEGALGGTGAGTGTTGTGSAGTDEDGFPLPPSTSAAGARASRGLDRDPGPGPSARIARIEEANDAAEELQGRFDQHLLTNQQIAGAVSGYAVDLAEAAASGEDMGEALGQVLLQMIKLVGQAAVFQLIMSRLGGTGGGIPNIFAPSAGSGGAAAALAGAGGGGPIPLFPKGIIPFASGGIITRGPMTFPLGNGFGGQAGEAGAEAIIPLSELGRTLDEAGVAGGGSTTIQIDARGSAPGEQAAAFNRMQAAIEQGVFSQLERSPNARRRAGIRGAAF